MSLNQAKLPAAEIESVIITNQLQQRSSRELNLEQENDAFHELAEHLATQPDQFLDRLVELAVKLCDADTVGISIEETNEKGERIFRWVAMAGELKHLIGGTTPRDFSPCGVCVDTNKPLLMERLERAYPYFGGAPLPFVEALLLPWNVGNAVGTLWIVAHTERRKFDRQDVRLMGCLTAFATGAIRLRQTILETQRALETAKMVADMAHHINNPLQGALLALFLVKDDLNLPPRCGRGWRLQKANCREWQLYRPSCFASRGLRSPSYSPCGAQPNWPRTNRLKLV